MQHEPTLARRYAFKLLANMASVPVYLVMEAILPRALGPQMYGNYSFVTNFFQQLLGFLDMGTSTCFYNALSRRQGEATLVSFYMRIMAILLLIVLSIGALLCIPRLGNWLLPDIPLWIVPYAALWAFLFWWTRVLRSMNDAIGATVRSELVRTVGSLAGVMLLLGLFFANALSLHTLFLQQYVLLGTTAAGFCLVMRGFWKNLTWQLEHMTAQGYKKEFFAYSHPLFVQALLSFCMLTGERWLLQWFDGSAEQGFFALSQKVSMACFLFVSAMTPLIMRELSIAWGKDNTKAMGSLITRFAPLLYVIAAYFSCFTLAEADVLVHIFGGAQFTAAILPVQIMALYPIHQTYGQLAGSVFHATGRTHILRNLTAIECIYGLLIAWFFLAPAEYGGLQWGATGLALKTVIVQYISVNICLWLVSRCIPFAFWRNFFHQIWSMALLLALAYGCRTLTHIFLPLDIVWRFLFSGCIYSILILLLIYFFPVCVQLQPQDMYEFRQRICKYFNKGNR